MLGRHSQFGISAHGWRAQLSSTEGAALRGARGRSPRGRSQKVKQSSLVAVTAVTLAVAAASAGAQAQTFPDLGHALYARGYSGSVWVNSFDPSQPYLAHGVFYPDTPFAASGSYETRYGMEVAGSGTVSVDANGLFAAAGTAHNPNAITADGSILIELLSDGNLAD